MTGVRAGIEILANLNASLCSNSGRSWSLSLSFSPSLEVAKLDVSPSSTLAREPRAYLRAVVDDDEEVDGAIGDDNGDLDVAVPDLELSPCCEVPLESVVPELALPPFAAAAASLACRSCSS